MKNKRVSILLATIICVLLLAGCGNNSNEVVTTNEMKDVTTEGDNIKKTKVFRDSAGREVVIPIEIKTIAPSGPLAQIVLFTACPDKLAGIATDFPKDANKYVNEKYLGLPKFGQFYGKNANLNMEALIKASPDIIIDIGEMKKTVVKDMDDLQNQLGIPVIFVEANLSNMDKTYNILSDLIGEEEYLNNLSKYCEGVISKADSINKSLKNQEKKSIYIALGKEGLNTNAAGSFQGQVADIVGAENVANVEIASAGGGTQVSIEQILLWQPDVIITDTDELYNRITTDAVWKDIKAVKEKKVFKIPSALYSFMGNPPSVNRIIGIQWLGNLLYPEKYSMDISREVKNFYKEFYHIDLKDDEISNIIKK